MESLKKILTLLALAAIVVGAIGGFWHLINIHEYVSAIGVAVVSAAAVPTVIKLWKFLKS